MQEASHNRRWRPAVTTCGAWHWMDITTQCLLDVYGLWFMVYGLLWTISYAIPARGPMENAQWWRNFVSQHLSVGKLGKLQSRKLASHMSRSSSWPSISSKAMRVWRRAKLDMHAGDFAAYSVDDAVQLQWSFPYRMFSLKFRPFPFRSQAYCALRLTWMEFTIIQICKVLAVSSAQLWDTS